MNAQAMEYDARKKSAGVAYLLLIFAGLLGVHRFYLGRTPSGLWILGLFVVGIVTSFAFIGVPLVAAALIWCVIDLFRIPGMVEAYNLGVIRRLGPAA